MQNIAYHCVAKKIEKNRTGRPTFFSLTWLIYKSNTAQNISENFQKLHLCKAVCTAFLAQRKGLWAFWLVEDPSMLPWKILEFSRKGRKFLSVLNIGTVLVSVSILKWAAVEHASFTLGNSPDVRMMAASNWQIYRSPKARTTQEHITNIQTIHSIIHVLELSRRDYQKFHTGIYFIKTWLWRGIREFNPKIPTVYCGTWGD